MASRAIGALLALAAAAAFVVSIATSAWWAGHPTIEGHFTTAKDVHVGLLGGQGCNTGGDGSCEALELDDTLTLVTYGELGATGLATLLLLATAIAALSISDNRKGMSTAAILTTLLAAGGAGAVLMLGPGIKASQTVEVPLGWGLYVFGGGVGAALLAALVTRKLEREPLRLKPSNAPLLQPAAVDVRQMLGRPSTPAPMTAQPEPQLRPLYENAGVAPIPTQPVLPTRSPTPMPHEQIEQLTGKPAPTPMTMTERGTKPAGMPPAGMPPEVRKKPPSAAPPRPSPLPSPLSPASASPMSSPGPAPHLSPGPSPSSSPGPAPRLSPGPSPIPRTNPPRTKPPSASPPPSPGKQQSAAPPPSPGKQQSAAPSPPPAKQPRAKTLQSGGEPAVKRPSHPPAPKVPMPAPRPSQPTMTHAVPPMPTADNQPPPAVLPAHRSGAEDGDLGELETGMMAAQRASTESDDRLETAMRATEHITAVEIDHEAKARAQHAKATPRSDTDARTGKQRTTPAVGDITDVGVEVAPPASIMTDRALSTQQREVARAPTDDPFENVRAVSLVTPVHGAPVSETLPAQRLSALFPAEDVPDEGPRGEDLMRTIEQNPKTPVPTIVAREQQSAERPASQVPMSTAPTSLPPPKNLNVETMPSGPTPACPQCESPMAWVEEHLRFYCKSCRMYF